MNRIIKIVAALLVLASCTPNVMDPSSQDYMIPAQGGSVFIEYNAKNDWSIMHNSKWFNVNPGHGDPGKCTIKVSAGPNDTGSTRSAQFYIVDGSSTVTIMVRQECSEVIEVESTDVFVPAKGRYSLMVSSNVDYQVSTDAEWINLHSTKAMKLTESELVFDLDENTTDKPRKGVVTLAGPTLTVNVTFHQGLAVGVAWTEPFFKSVLGVKFTGDWCGYCPTLAADLSDFCAANPGRISYMNVYNASAENLMYSYGARYQSYYAVNGFPTLALDNRASFANLGSSLNKKVIEDMVAEEIEFLPAQTVISMETYMENGKVFVKPTIHSAENLTCHVHVALLENDIIGAQASGGSSYNHSHVLKAMLTTPVTGEEYTLAAQSSTELEFSAALPSNIVDKKNLSVLVFVTKPVPSDAPKKVSRVEYYPAYVNMEMVDNSASCSLGSRVEIRYE